MLKRVMKKPNNVFLHIREVFEATGLMQILRMEGSGNGLDIWRAKNVFIETSSSYFIHNGRPAHLFKAEVGTPDLIL